MSNLETQLAGVLAREIEDFVEVNEVERLSGGASQETLSVRVTTGSGPLRLALRRVPGGAPDTPGFGRAGLDTEATLFEVARAAGVPVPRVRCRLGAGDGLGSGFVMDWVDGETLGARIARHADFADVRPRLARQCGEILAAIHAIEVTQAGLDAQLETLNTATFVRRLWTHYQDFQTPQPMIDYTAQWLLANLPAPRPATLVHNDFRNGNLMVSPTRGVVAVLDWEVAHIGDPMRDLGWICTPSWRFGVHELEVGGFGTLDDLLDGYAAVSGERPAPEVVRFWQIFGSFWWAVHTLTMADQYRTGPDRTVERPGIGRRSSECQIDCVNLLLPGAVSVPDQAQPADSNMPRDDELLLSVRDFLREAVTEQTSGRTRFLARVAANSLDILEREARLGPALAAAELARLEDLLDQRAPLETLRLELVRRLRDGRFDLDDDALGQHLRATVAGRVAVDQPAYAGLATALAGNT